MANAYAPVTYQPNESSGGTRDQDYWNWVQSVKDNFAPASAQQESGTDTSGQNKSNPYLPQDTVDALLAQSKGSTYLNPFYTQYLRDNAKRLYAGYQLEQVRSGSAQPSQSFGQWLKDRISSGYSGNGGPQQSQVFSWTGVDSGNQDANGNFSAPGRGQVADVLAHLRDNDQGAGYQALRQSPSVLQSILDSVAAGPFAQYYRSTLSDALAPYRYNPAGLGGAGGYANAVMQWARNAGYAV